MNNSGLKLWVDNSAFTNQGYFCYSRKEITKRQFYEVEGIMKVERLTKYRYGIEMCSMFNTDNFEKDYRRKYYLICFHKSAQQFIYNKLKIFKI